MLPQKIAHLDLKGIQRRPDELLRHLEWLGDLGYDAILVEYEDRFPFHTARFAIAPDEVWTREFHREFLDHAAACGLAVIPLQQSLAHLEYALRWERYREHGITDPLSHDQIESTTLHLGREQSRRWMKSLLREIMEAHPDSPYIHLGMDESWSLGVYARGGGVAPLALFLDWLEELCAFCHGMGRTPLIWSDMLEDHLEPGILERLRALREKVVLVVWDYLASERPAAVVRFAGWRTSRHRAAAMREDGADHLKPHHLWMEDWAPEIAALARPYRAGDHFMESLFQAAVWKQLGFRVLGASAICIMAEGALLPAAHRRMANIERWKQCRTGWQLDGLITTAWARGGTFHPPTLIPDLLLPLWEYAAGGENVAAFRGIPREELHALLVEAGRCAEGGCSAAQLQQRLEELSPLVESHREEWETWRLIVETLAARARVESLVAEARKSRYANRMTRVEWGCRLDRCREMRRRYPELRRRVARHLEKRYTGTALHEWLANLFDVPLRDLEEAERLIAAYLTESTARFSETSS